MCEKNLENGNNGIQKCFIVLGYYIAFQDLSKALIDGKDKMSKIYYPLLQDTHQWDRSIEYDMWTDIPLFDMETRKTIEKKDLEIMLLRNQYYSDLIRRKPFYDFEGRNWSELSGEEKIMYGQKRAEGHNKFVKYFDSYVENKLVLKEYVDMLVTNGIKPIFIIMPFSEAYNKYVDVDMKNAALDMICQFSKEIEWLDLNNYEYFDDEDFIDTDHLNGKGAYKFSKIITEMYGRQADVV